METLSRPLLSLKGHELVPLDEDRKVELDIIDVLLPCRTYEMKYKVAVAAKVSPTLEFLLRLLKSAPGMNEPDVAEFFGYSVNELEYVLSEASEPGYIERKQGRLWLTTAGDSLFRADQKEPSIYSVESRRRGVGFDLVAIAPQPRKRPDSIERFLPELGLSDLAGSGRTTQQLPARFERFFREIADQVDRGKGEKRQLYSIDPVIVAQERYQVPLRIRTYARASNPSVPEIDLSSWRPEHEIADRPEIENAVALFVKDLATHANQLDAVASYDALVSLAPEFLKEFTVKTGLNERRYWREAIGRVGEVRSDRKTIPLVGSLLLENNLQRFLSILDYGAAQATAAPERIIAVAPQTRHWGATTQLRGLLALIKEKVGKIDAGDATSETLSMCLTRAAPPRFIKETFDEIAESDAARFPRGLELYLVPSIAMAAIVHAPLGASIGNTVPLGIASFDPAVLERCEQYLEDNRPKEP
ncbi:hypothetical protein EQ718_07395 [Paracoccus versutus]|uniref:Uncharacterized protein n=1 Tax=Paracoccus versutus TaxID=34007 RepID=A0AAQ0HKZ5_PARVE|nr:hypothetical protein [Paracoccus versutus]REG52449.1 hypothetical protein ATH84_100821 [Paracoccus versutus]WEJ78713.1 hypothetical protein EQ718_07395 [Paracoccus versutus]